MEKMFNFVADHFTSMTPIEKLYFEVFDMKFEPKSFFDLVVLMPRNALEVYGRLQTYPNIKLPNNVFTAVSYYYVHSMDINDICTEMSLSAEEVEQLIGEGISLLRNPIRKRYLIYGDEFIKEIESIRNDIRSYDRTFCDKKSIIKHLDSECVEETEKKDEVMEVKNDIPETAEEDNRSKILNFIVHPEAFGLTLEKDDDEDEEKPSEEPKKSSYTYIDSGEIVDGRHIKELGLSIRPYNCLWRAGVHTVETLMCMSYKQLMKIRNLGRRSLIEVIKTVRDKVDPTWLMAEEEVEKMLKKAM